MNALVTGASGGIGTAIASSLARMGFTVIAHYNSIRPVELLEAEPELADRFIPFKADLSDPEEVDALADFALEKGGVGILVNNAGMSIFSPFFEVDDKEEEKLFSVNTLSPIRLTKRLLPAMLASKSGSIVNIASVWGLRGASCEVHYSASKAAIIGFTKSLALELEPSRISVNCIAPGFVDTKMNSRLSEEEKADFLASAPSKRAIAPEEIAEKVISLALGRDFVTGQIITME